MTNDELQELKEHINGIEQAHKRAEEYRRFADIIDGEPVIVISKDEYRFTLGCDDGDENSDDYIDTDYDIICGLVDLIRKVADKLDEPLTNLRVLKENDNA